MLARSGTGNNTLQNKTRPKIHQKWSRCSDFGKVFEHEPTSTNITSKATLNDTRHRKKVPSRSPKAQQKGTKFIKMNKNAQNDVCPDQLMPKLRMVTRFRTKNTKTALKAWPPDIWAFYKCLRSVADLQLL